MTRDRFAPFSLAAFSSSWAGLTMLACSGASPPPNTVPGEQPTTQGSPPRPVLTRTATNNTRAPTIALRCAMSRSEAAADSVPQVVIELASLRGDLSNLNGSPGHIPQEGPRSHDHVAPRAHSAIAPFLDQSELSVERVTTLLATSDQTRRLPWDFGARAGNDALPDNARPDGTDTASPATSQAAQCTNADWEIAVTPHVDPPDAESVRIEFALSTSTAPASALHTTLILADQQSVLLPVQKTICLPGNPDLLVMTPYIIRTPKDLHSLLECKRNALGSPPIDGYPAAIPPEPKP